MKTLRIACCFALLLAAWLLPSFAHAHLGQQRAVIETRKRPEVPREGKRGRAEVTIAGGKRVLELAPSPDGLAGSFTLKNVGDGPLEVFSVALEAEEGEPRAAVGLGIQSPSRESKPLSPGETRTYTVVWRSEQTLARQLHGFLLVQTDSAEANASRYDPPLVVAVVADRRPFWQRSLLSILIFAPLAISLLAFASLRLPILNVRRLRLGAIGVAALVGVVSFAPALTFVRVFSREDGGFGLQHIERVGLGGGLEYHLAVDGLNVAMLPALAILLLSILVAVGDAPRARAVVGFSALATSAATLFVVSQGLLLATVALGGFSVSVLALVYSGRERSRDHRALVTTGAALLFGTGTFAFLTHWLSRAAERARSFDGTVFDLTDALPEIARAATHGHALSHDAPRLLGMPPAEGAVVLAFLAFLPFLAAVPLHRWIGDLYEREGAAAAALVAGLASTIGFLGLSRFTLVIFPQQIALIESVARSVGLVTLLWCGLRAAFSNDLRLLAGHLSSASGGIVLIALASITPQGLSAAIALTLTRTAALPLLCLVVGALVSRTGSGRLAQNDGLLVATPRLALVWLLAVLGAAAVGGAFFALFLSVVASVGVAPWSAVVFAAGLIVLGAGVARALQLLSAGVPGWWQTSPRFEPHGGTMPDLRGREAGWSLILGVLVLSFLLAPRFWLGLADATVLDTFRALVPPGATQTS